MSSTLSPEYDMANNLSAQMAPSQLSRRTSRSSGSQSGYRVEKPKSNHNSPRTVERRKTTTGTKRYATLDDHFNMMFGVAGVEEPEEHRPESSRPMSWHPSSESQGLSVQTSGQDWSRHSAYGSDFYSLSARSPMYPEQMQNYPTYLSSHDSHRDSQASGNSWYAQNTQSYAVSAFSTPSIETMPWSLSQWVETEVPSSRNASTDFLPIQHPSANEAESMEDEEMENSGKELVGMGLYDLPDSDSSWNSSSLLQGTGKGLKLEETWQPPEENEDEDADGDDDDDEANDASSDEGSIEDLPVAREELPMSNVKPQIASSLDGRSFFFEEDESCTKEWWYHQLQQPSMPVQDTGFGYGWL